MNIQRAMAQVSRFSSMATARSFADRCHKSQAIVLGDDGMYWVCSGCVAGWLRSRGYTVVR